MTELSRLAIWPVRIVKHVSRRGVDLVNLLRDGVRLRGAGTVR